MDDLELDMEALEAALLKVHCTTFGNEWHTHTLHSSCPLHSDNAFKPRACSVCNVRVETIIRLPMANCCNREDTKVLRQRWQLALRQANRKGTPMFQWGEERCIIILADTNRKGAM